MRITLLALFTAIVVIACTKKDDPVPAKACFNFAPSEDLYPGDEITFTNCSEDAESYFWDFNNGDTSTLESPKYTYLEAGTYEVELYAEGEKDDSLSQTLTISEFPSHFKIDNDSYDLAQGLTEYYGYYEGGDYNFDLILISDDIDYDIIDGKLANVTGTGDIIVFTLYSDNPESLGEGTYNYSFTADPFTFTEAFALVNYNVETEEVDFAYSINSGYMEVSKVDELTIIDYNLTSFDGKMVTGSFRGILANFDYSEDSRKSVKTGMWKSN